MDSPLKTTLGHRNTALLESADDFHHYRRHLTNRIVKLRHDLKIQTKNTKNYQKSQELISKKFFLDSEQNDKNSNSKDDDISMGSDNNNSSSSFLDSDKFQKFSLLLLLTAERDWVHGLETKFILNVKGSKRREKYLDAKYKKSLKSIQTLVKFIETTNTNPVLSQSSKLEIYAYQALVIGYLKTGVRNWKAATEAFSNAIIILAYLNRINPSSTELYKEIDKSIEPVLTVAAFNQFSTFSSDLFGIGAKGYNPSNPAIISILAEDPDFIKTRGRGIAGSEEEIETEITWRDHHAQLYDDGVARLLARAKTAQKELTDKLENPSSEESKETWFDPVIEIWSDALEAHKKEMEQSAETIDQNDDSEQHRQIVLSFIKYHMLFVTIQRAQVLINSNLIDEKKTKSSNSKKIEKNKDIIRLQESISATLEQINDLPGVYSDDDLFSSLNTFALYSRIRRILTIVDSYTISTDVTDATVKSLALANKANELSKDLGEIKVVFPGDIITTKDVNSLKSETRTLTEKLHLLAHVEKSKPTNKSAIIGNDISIYPTGTPDEILNNIIPLTPKVEPVSVKPVLFDIGFNYITYDGPVSDSLDEIKHEEEKQNEKKKGFFGSIFGR